MRRTQAERSATTKAKLLAATVASLVERGYPGTTTTEVCRRAQVSRGAQLHHYATRAELVAAAVEHLFELRHAELRESLSKLDPGQDLLQQVFARMWEIYSGETLCAWQELVVAGRTDPALGRAVAEVNARFVLAANETFTALFAVAPAKAAVGVRLVTAFFDGLALGRALDDDPQLYSSTITQFQALVRPWLETA
jgi:AcrR family transcriptional regulator